jgi:transcriptional regulator with XRE-family HTH domain
MQLGEWQMRLDKAEEGCEVWEEVPLVSILHSRLSDLEPIGVGTPMVECLTSYITRLADAHSVSPITLVTREVLPRAAPLYGQQDGKWVSNQWTSVARSSALLNGVVRGTQNWVQVLEQLTGRGDLRFLTLLTFAQVLPPRNLLRRFRAWCPLCYQKWYEAGLIVYDPLLWNLECVTICGHHHLPLHHCCPHAGCGAALFPLEPRMVPGYCPKCHRWLGYTKHLTEPEDPGSDCEWQWQFWGEQTVGELLAAQPKLSVLPSRERVAVRLSTYMDALLNGKKMELARRLNRNGSSIRDWLAGKQLPHLGNLLRICFLFHTTPLQWFTETVQEEFFPLQTVPQESVSGVQMRRQVRRFDPFGIKLALEQALCQVPAPPMRQVAKCLGYDPSQVYKYFPDLCQAISRRYRARQAKNKQLRRQREREQLCDAMRKFHEQGIYPGQRRLQQFLSKPGFFRDAWMKAAWYEVLRELGWKS